MVNIVDYCRSFRFHSRKHQRDSASKVSCPYLGAIELFYATNKGISVLDGDFGAHLVKLGHMLEPSFKYRFYNNAGSVGYCFKNHSLRL
jgi:hypothetical protein